MMDVANGVTVHLTPLGIAGGIAGVLVLAAALAAGAVAWARSQRRLAAMQRSLADSQAQAHRLQLLHEFQTHTLPEAIPELGRLARRLGERPTKRRSREATRRHDFRRQEHESTWQDDSRARWPSSPAAAQAG